MTLPHAELSFGWDAAHAVTEVVGWHKQHGDSTRIRQIGVVWRTAEGYRQQPRVTMPRPGKKLADQLGDPLHVPVLCAKQPLIGKGKGRGRKRS